MNDKNNFLSVAREQTKNLNIFMKSKSNSQANGVFSYLFNDVLPKCSNNRVAPGDWSLHTGMEFIDYQICLLANCRNPVRCLAILEKSSDRSSSAKQVLDKLCYSVFKIQIKNSKKGTAYLAVAKTPPGKLCTTRRGFFAIEMNIYNEKLSGYLDCGEFKLRKEQQARIADIYFKYVYGMEERPTSKLHRNKLDFGMEQFLLNEYPTEEWKKDVLNKNENRLIDLKSESDNEEKIEIKDKRRRKNETSDVINIRGRYDDDAEGDDTVFKNLVDENVNNEVTWLDDVNEE